VGSEQDGGAEPGSGTERAGEGGGDAEVAGAPEVAGANHGAGAPEVAAAGGSGPSDADICAHHGEADQRFLGAAVPPIFQNTLFEYDASEYIYTRLSNPTIAVAEQKVAALEQAEAARCFGSGMAAISAAVLSSVKAGDTILAMKSIYGLTRLLFTDWLPRFGLHTRFVSGTGPEEFEEALDDGTSLIYLESPTTFNFRLVDLAGVAEIARSRGITTIIDNSWATPLYQKPLRAGIDLSVHSASKYLGGHSDIVAGVVASSAERLRKIEFSERMLLGGSMDPHQAWLLTRGLRTLPVRMRQHREAGLQVARALAVEPQVTEVRHPALVGEADAGQDALVRRYLGGTTGLFAVLLDTDAAGLERFRDALSLFREAPSWGGFESLIYLPALRRTPEQLQAAEIPPNLVRISVGLESVDSLVADLRRGLAAV
jgi:cystathionine gamma-lyase